MTASAALALALLLTGAAVLALVSATVVRRVARRRRLARVRRATEPLRPQLVLLVAGEPEESADAASRLAVLDAPSWRAVEPAVVTLLGKVRGDSRREVVELLTERGVLDRARLDLRRRSAVRRCAAAELLGRAEDPTAVRVLVRLLRDPDANVRRVSARALGRIGAPAAAAPLLAALGAAPQRSPALVPAPVVAQALLRVGAAASPALLDVLAHPSPVVRTTSVEVLGRLGTTAAVPALLERLRDDDLVEVRTRAATALGALGMPTALVGLLTATGPDEPSAVRAAATRALGELGDPDACPLLCALLDDDDDQVAAAAGPALLQLGARGAALLDLVATDTRGGLLRAPVLAREALTADAVRRPQPAGAR